MTCAASWPTCTRPWHATFLEGTEDALEAHTARMFALEQEFLAGSRATRRRTRAGPGRGVASSAAETRAAGQVADTAKEHAQPVLQEAKHAAHQVGKNQKQPAREASTREVGAAAGARRSRTRARPPPGRRSRRTVELTAPDRPTCDRVRVKGSTQGREE